MLETTCSLLLSTFIPSQFWAETILTFIYLTSQIPSSIISGLFVFKRRFSTSPNYEELRVYQDRIWWKPLQFRLEPSVQLCRKTHLGHYSNPDSNSSGEAPFIHFSFFVCSKSRLLITTQKVLFYSL